MEFGLVTISLLVIAAVFVLLGLKLLGRKGWILGFLRGALGLACLLWAVFLLMSGLSIASYVELKDGQVLANVGFKQRADQSFAPR